MTILHLRTGRTPRLDSITIGFEFCFPFWFEGKFRQILFGTISNRRDSQGTLLFRAGLGNEYSFYSIGFTI